MQEQVRLPEFLVHFAFPEFLVNYTKNTLFLAKLYPNPPFHPLKMKIWSELGTSSYEPKNTPRSLNEKFD